VPRLPKLLKVRAGPGVRPTARLHGLIENRQSKIENAAALSPRTPHEIHSWSVSHYRLNTPDRDLSVEELTGRPRRSMSLIEKSEISPAEQSCENADNVTITTVFPTV